MSVSQMVVRQVSSGPVSVDHYSIGQMFVSQMFFDQEAWNHFQPQSFHVNRYAAALKMIMFPPIFFQFKKQIHIMFFF